VKLNSVVSGCYAAFSDVVDTRCSLTTPPVGEILSQILRLPEGGNPISSINSPKVQIFCSASKEDNLTDALGGYSAPPYESRNVGPVTVPA